MSMRIVARTVLAVLSLVAMWGCQVDYHAAPAPYDHAPLTEAERAELNELKAQLDQTRKHLADTRAELAAMDGRVNAMEGAVQEIKSGAVPGSGSLPELGERLAALETEVRTQRALLQVREEELRLLRDAVLPPRKRPADTAAVGPEAGDPGTPEPKVPPKPAAPGQVGAVTPVAEQDYENAWKRLKEKDYRGAIQQFKKFVEKHPNMALTDNAQYWIGESYYALQEFDQAILEFDEVRKKYPDGDKAPGAWLKIGFAFAELGNRVDARLILQEVINRFPQSDAAEKAREKIRSLDT